MHTEEEAKKLWCPMSRPSMPRVDDCGYQAGNRVEGSGPGQEPLWPQNTCLASKCAMWRWVTPHGSKEFKDSGRASGYCGLAK